MTRRDFCLGSALALAAARPVAFGQSPSTAAAIPVIDTHTHFYDPTRPQGVPWPKPDNTALYAPHLPADYRRVTATLPVAGTVVVEASPWVEDNAWVLELAAREPMIVGFVGNLSPGQGDFAGNLARFAANPLFRGLRLGRTALDSVGKDAVDRDISALLEADLTVDVLDGTPNLAGTLRLARKWPDLRIVVDHVSVAEWSDARRTVLAELAARPNVFLKISEVARPRDGRLLQDPAYYRPAVDGLLALFGPRRLLYGSNWPVCERVAPLAVGLGIVQACFADQPRSVAENFFWRNSLAVYRWIPRGPAATLIHS